MRLRLTCSTALACAVALAQGLAAQQPSPFRFEPVQPDLLSLGGSLVNAWADYDGDEDLDLFVGFNGTPNRLYRNDRGVLTDVAAAAGVADARATRAAAWGDFDGDGDADLLVGFAPGAGSVLRLYRNDRGTFHDVTAPYGLTRDSGAVRQPVWVDYDDDGDLDLFVAFRDRANAFFRNEALLGRFSDVAAEVGLADSRRSVGAVWFDYDEDGDLDVYVGNMDGDANGLFRNDRGGFQDVAEVEGLAWGGRLPNDRSNGTVRPCVADVNGDGHLDLFTANYGKNGLFLNRGNGRFEDASARWGIDIDARYDSCAFADVDHDGRLDLYVNGTVTGGVSYRDYLFRNVGDRFVDATPEAVRALEADHGVQWADFDGDGDVDLALTGARPDGMHVILRNMLPAKDAARSLAVRVVDVYGEAPVAGAEVRLYAAGTQRVLGTRLVDGGSGYNSQSAMPVHFGLPTDSLVEVEVTWPAAGRRARSWRRLASPGAEPPPAVEARLPLPETTTRVLINAFGSSNAALGRSAARTIGPALQRRWQRKAYVIRREDVNATLQTEFPACDPPLASTTVCAQELGRLMRADIVIGLDAGETTNGVVLRARIVRPLGVRTEGPTIEVRAPSLDEAVAALAARLSTAVTLRPPRSR